MQAELITAAPWHASTGDMAIARATAAELAARGVHVTQPVFPSNRRTCVVGGGHILGPPGESMCGHFRIKGSHVLNAAGVRKEGRDFDYLRHYRYLAVRDEFSANVIGLPNVHIVPCPATLRQPLPRSFVASLPGFDWLRRLTPGDYVVLHATAELHRLARTLRQPAIAVDPQPWAGRKWNAPCLRVPPTHSPEVLLTIVAGAKAVVSRSLHLAIFALATGVPFCIVDRGNDQQSLKMRRYFNRAGLPDAMHKGPDPIRHALALAGEIAAVRAIERQRAIEHLDAMAAAILDAP